MMRGNIKLLLAGDKIRRKASATGRSKSQIPQATVIRRHFMFIHSNSELNLDQA
eukprot:CAMPEP_0119019010 /NCGR_PEP_ID=MMETSP1176-20130426/20767_1 /TAXON_ID=265551 /ORGANISM="Synedropsis recta cf, Strain CCMP1620" /LENGTH=53 /DNA_ID=CAMNT_0006973131 /DNA_START=1 /DNA_END=158 /DNA_ORIENTATION=+